MNLRDLNLKKAYSSDTDDIVNDFYIPTLQSSIEYHRLAGFFSSSSLATAARGIHGLILNGGCMKLIACPRLTKADIDAVLTAKEDPQEYLPPAMLRELEKPMEEFMRDHVRALGWMVAAGKLEILVCLPCDEGGHPYDEDSVGRSGIFHQKVGIFRDKDDNIVSFSGSVNESATGWMGNIEEFKVFRSWEASEYEYQWSDILKFERFWGGRAPKIMTCPVPDAVRRRLVELAPDNITDIPINRWYCAGSRSHPKRTELYDYQKEAVAAWVANDHKGIFEMATGTGKTFTALACIETAFSSGHANGAIIAAPYQHLSQQWAGEIEKHGLKHDEVIFADSSRQGWKNRLADRLIEMSLGYRNHIIVLTTHDSLCSPDFREIIRAHRSKSSLALIADEMHGLGAEKSRSTLLQDYTARLGLSATPNRWFDPTGTEILLDYFGGVVYEFTLDKAINTVNQATGTTFLTPYRYLPRFVSMTIEELAEYIRKTQALVCAIEKSSVGEPDVSVRERILFARANIVKNANGKYSMLHRIIDELGSDLKWTIIYCSPQQIDESVRILNERMITQHRFTMDEGTTPNPEFGGRSEREYLLDLFAKGEYDALVAMKCLDEGVDVPPARVGILMCSSGNPREYIQRIGRLIRRHEGKGAAMVYDIIVAPSIKALPPELAALERRIFSRELWRCRQIAEMAQNSAEALSFLDNAMNESF